jgi:hypothetical protein
MMNMLLIIWLLFGTGTAVAASKQGRSGLVWFLLGILLGPFALFYVLWVTPKHLKIKEPNASEQRTKQDRARQEFKKPNFKNKVSGRVWIIFVILLILGIIIKLGGKTSQKSASTSSVSTTSIASPKIESKVEPEKKPEKPKSSGDYLKDAKMQLAMKSPENPHGHIWEAEMELVNIEKGAKEYPEAQQLLKKIRKWKADWYKAAERRKIESHREERILYATSLEKEFLEKGYDAYVKVTGKDATTLTLKCVLFSRPIIYNLTKDGKLFRTWYDMGFRKVIFSDGWRHYDYKF